MENFQCPGCHSNKITFIADHIVCLNCGRQDYLYDFRNDYDLRRDKPKDVKSQAK